MTDMQRERNDNPMTTHPVRKADDDWPAPVGPIGHVSEVDDGGAQKYLEFHPLEEELTVLAKHHAEILMAIEYYWCLYQLYMDFDITEHRFVRSRLSKIHDALGAEAFDKAIDEVEQTFGSRQDKEAWEIFLHGSEEEKAALFRRNMERGDIKYEDWPPNFPRY